MGFYVMLPGYFGGTLHLIRCRSFCSRVLHVLELLLLKYRCSTFCLLCPTHWSPLFRTGWSLVMGFAQNYQTIFRKQYILEAITH